MSINTLTNIAIASIQISTGMQLVTVVIGPIDATGTCWYNSVHMYNIYTYVCICIYIIEGSESKGPTLGLP